MAPKRKYDYAPELQDRMLALHTDMPWSKVVDKLGLTCTKQAFYLHIQEAKIRKDAEFYARNRNGSHLVGRVYAEYDLRPEQFEPKAPQTPGENWVTCGLGKLAR